MYDLPDIDFVGFKNKILKFFKNKVLLVSVSLVAVGCVLGFFAGMAVLDYFPSQVRQAAQYLQIPYSELEKNNNTAEQESYNSVISYEQAIIDAAKKISPSVVSIVISKNVPIYEQQFTNPFGENSPFDLQIPQYVQKGTELQEVGAGSGFIVSADGLIFTNKHVVFYKKAEYTVYTNEGEKYTAKVLALDPVQDLAVIRIQAKLPAQAGLTAQGVFKPVVLGDSSGIQTGQTVVAIGNALGQFTNTVSVGIVSGLGRTISASDQAGSFSETLEGIIQTDAAINSGNFGGPLVNLRGEVIGINTAMAQGAQSIGFAIPINAAKKDIEQVSSLNKIVYPFLGVRYVLVDEAVKQKYNLLADTGAFVVRGSNGESAITAGSAAEKSGIKENDVILEINGEKITKNNSMAKIIQKYSPGEKITLKVLRDSKEISVDVTLGERSS